MAGAWLREGYLDDEHGHGRKLATKGLLGLDLRERVTWRNAAAPAETSSQYRTGRLLPAGVGTAGAVELEQWHCSPNNVQELDQSGWSSPAGGAFRRRLAQAGEAQAPPPLQQPPPWQMVDLARYARAVAGNADTVDTASSSPVVLFDRVASKTRAMTPSWSSSALDREAAAAECTDSSDRGWAGSSGRAHYGHRDHRRAFSDGHYRDTAGLPPSIWAPLQGQGGQHGSWPSRSPLTGPRWPSRTAAPARSLGVRESDRHLPPAPAVRTETTALLLKRRHLPFAESQGWCGGGGRLRQGEGDLTSSRPEGESRWLGAGNQAFCGGAHTDSDHDRELCHDNTPPRDDAPPRAQHPPYSPDHHRLWRQSSTSPLAGATTVTTATTIPEPERLGDGDFVECRIAVRPLMCPVTSNCVGPPSPLPGLAKVVATAARDQAAEGFRCFSTVGNFHGHLVGGGHDGAGEGAGGGGGGVIEWGHRKQEEERRPCDQVPTETTSTGGTCMEEGCGRRARFSFKGTRKAVYCVKHKLVGGMVDTRHRLCKSEECTRQPSFGMEGDQRPSYCARHKEAGMINVAARRCGQIGCRRHPNFGFPGDKRPSYCKRHREMGMVDVASRRCRDPWCSTRPLYNMYGLRPVCCSKHKTPGMIDVVSARCQEPGCSSHPSFGYASERKSRRCAKHRLEHMVSVKGRHRGPRRDVTTAHAAADTTNATSPPGPSSSTASFP